MKPFVRSLSLLETIHPSIEGSPGLQQVDGEKTTVVFASVLMMFAEFACTLGSDRRILGEF